MSGHSRKLIMDEEMALLLEYRGAYKTKRRGRMQVVVRIRLPIFYHFNDDLPESRPRAELDD